MTIRGRGNGEEWGRRRATSDVQPRLTRLFRAASTAVWFYEDQLLHSRTLYFDSLSISQVLEPTEKLQTMLRQNTKTVS